MFVPALSLGIYAHHLESNNSLFMKNDSPLMDPSVSVNRAKENTSKPFQ